MSLFESLLFIIKKSTKKQLEWNSEFVSILPLGTLELQVSFRIGRHATNYK